MIKQLKSSLGVIQFLPSSSSQVLPCFEYPVTTRLTICLLTPQFGLQFALIVHWVGEPALADKREIAAWFANSLKEYVLKAFNVPV